MQTRAPEFCMLLTNVRVFLGSIMLGSGGMIYRHHLKAPGSVACLRDVEQRPAARLHTSQAFEKESWA